MPLTLVVCKLLESLLRDHMVINKHNLLNNSQHGFMKGFTRVYRNNDEASPVDVIYLDFHKAFDKVPHQGLIIKLRAHAMGDSIVNWVSNWLKSHFTYKVLLYATVW